MGHRETAQSGKQQSLDTGFLENPGLVGSLVSLPSSPTQEGIAGGPGWDASGGLSDLADSHSIVLGHESQLSSSASKTGALCRPRGTEVKRKRSYLVEEAKTGIYKLALQFRSGGIPKT